MKYVRTKVRGPFPTLYHDALSALIHATGSEENDRFIRSRVARCIRFLRSERDPIDARAMSYEAAALSCPMNPAKMNRLANRFDESLAEANGPQCPDRPSAGSCASENGQGFGPCRYCGRDVSTIA